VLERIEKCLQGLLPEEEEYDDAAATNDLQQR
jgi:hypothetical protein